MIHVKINELEEKSKLDQLVTTENIKMLIGGETGIHGYRGSNSDSDWLDDDITWQHRIHSDWWRRARAFFYKNDFRYENVEQNSRENCENWTGKTKYNKKVFQSIVNRLSLVNKMNMSVRGWGSMYNEVQVQQG